MILRLKTYSAAGVLGLLALLLAVESASGTQHSHIHGIAFDPNDPTSLLIATHHGFYRASDGGVVERVSRDRNDYMGFILHPTDPDVMFASGHPETGGNMGFISSSDGGASWKLLSPGHGGPVDFHAIAVSHVDPQVMYGTFAGIQVTTDGGASWSLAGPGPDRVIDLAASPSDAATVYAGTAAGLMVSRDGGASWYAASGPAEPASLVEFAPDGSLFVYFVPSGLHKGAPDGGAVAPLAPAPDILLHLAVHPLDPMHLVAVTRNSVVSRSRDGGVTWIELAL